MARWAVGAAGWGNKKTTGRQGPVVCFGNWAGVEPGRVRATKNHRLWAHLWSLLHPRNQIGSSWLAANRCTRATRRCSRGCQDSHFLHCHEYLLFYDFVGQSSIPGREMSIAVPICPAGSRLARQQPPHRLQQLFRLERLGQELRPLEHHGIVMQRNLVGVAGNKQHG